MVYIEVELLFVRATAYADQWTTDLPLALSDDFKSSHTDDFRYSEPVDYKFSNSYPDELKYSHSELSVHIR